MACHVVPQTTTQIANSCQVLKRDIRARSSSERVARAASHPLRERAADALDDDGVHREGEGAAEARVGAILREHVADRVPGNPGGGIDVGDRAASARLDE